MRTVVTLAYFILLYITAATGQTNNLKNNSSRKLSVIDSLLIKKNISARVNNTDSASMLLELIKIADGSLSRHELIEVVNFCTSRFPLSDTVSAALTRWLREDHLIYAGKSPSAANGFRIFLLSMMSKMMPNAALYHCVKSEFLFSDQLLNLTAAARTAKIFPSEGKELARMMNTFLNRSLSDEYVDISTPEFSYPMANPTKLKYEMIRSLPYFGEDAYPSVKYIKEIIQQEEEKAATKDTLLVSLAQNAVNLIEQQTPLCCRKEQTDDNTFIPGRVDIIPVKARNDFLQKELKLYDQNGDSIKLKDLFGKPSVFTFFYTSCTNSLKCAATVSNLAKLQKLVTEHRQQKKLYIYAMTYDPDFDKPMILKNYGSFYGIDFSTNTRFLGLVTGNEQNDYRHLNLRVNYGVGSINQHGIQLFLLDKKGKIAAVYDNQLWNVNDVYSKLTELSKE